MKKENWQEPHLPMAVLLLLSFGLGTFTGAKEPKVDPQVRTIASDSHVEAVLCIAFSPAGKHLASGGDGGEVVLWDAAAWREVRNLRGDSSGKAGHSSDVWGLAFSPDGKQLASASHDETVRLWDVSTGEQLRVLREHSFHVWGVAFSPDGTRLASAGGTSNPNGQFAAGEVKIWDLATGQVLGAMTSPSVRVYDVAFSPDGKRLASAWEDKTVKILDAATGQPAMTLTGHDSEVRVVAWGPDGKQLLSGSDDKTVRLFDVNTQREVRTFPGYHGAAVSSDGMVLAMGGEAGVRLWDLANEKELKSIPGGVRFSRLALSPNRKQVGWDAGRTLKVWTPVD